MTGFRLLVFDWDGTLMDSEAKIVSCLDLTLRDLGRPALPREALLNVIGLGLPEVARALLPGAEAEMARRFIDRYRYHFLSDHLAPSTLFPGTLDTLKELDRRGYLLGVATGKGRLGLQRSLEDTASAGLFAATRCADETASKPNPRMLFELMEVTGVAAGETLMVGDTEYDLLMARSAGVSAVAVSYGVHERERLLAHRPLACLDDIRDIVRFLDKGVAGT
jgi:phosphoglycolate phosphatase